MNARHQNRVEPKPRIACINDSYDLLVMMRTLLAEEGYAATPLPVTRGSLSSLIKHPPDAIIFDLPARSPRGWDLLELIHSHPTTASIPRVLISTNTDAFAVIQSNPHRYGADRFVLKPFDAFELCDTVREVIGAPLTTRDDLSFRSD